MQINPAALTEAVFIAALIEHPGGGEEVQVIGTGCFVDVYGPGHRFFPYLVTCRHVARELACRRAWLIANRLDGAAEAWPLETVNGTEPRRWYHHPDVSQNVDIAVTPMAPPDESEVSLIPSFTLVERRELIATAADYRERQAQAKQGLFDGQPVRVGDEAKFRLRRIRVGNEVAMVGLFVPHQGADRIHPIVRVGNIAMIPWDGERVPTEPDGDMELVLIEARSIGGMSGSPVMVIEDQKAPDSVLRMLGIARGHWEVSARARNALGGLNISFPDAASSPEAARSPDDELVNYGIASVVPAWKLQETLDQDELQTLRASGSHPVIEVADAIARAISVSGAEIVERAGGASPPPDQSSR